MPLATCNALHPQPLQLQHQLQYPARQVYSELSITVIITLTTAFDDDPIMSDDGDFRHGATEVHISEASLTLTLSAYLRGLPNSNPICL